MIAIAAEIDIAAPPERVWAILTDFARFPDWNPMVTEAIGEARPGARLAITVAAPDGSGRSYRFRPVVVAAARGKELAWRGGLALPALFDGLHYWRMTPTPLGTRLTHGEEFSGLAVSLMGRRRIEAFLPGYRAMNEALKARVESAA